VIPLVAFLQVFVASPVDQLSDIERLALVDATSPYARCINAHLPQGYFDWPRRPARDDAEVRTRVDKTALAFGRCQRERAAVAERASPAFQAGNAKLVMFVDRLEDSYTYPVMVGSEPTLLIDPRKTETSNAPN
jgi:hypothetical protein